MSFTRYQAIVKVAELGSITKAAIDLNYSQPNISHLINSFEEEVGFPIFMRNRDSITITENGKKVLNYCKQIIKKEQDLQLTISSINGLRKGILRISSLNCMLCDFIPLVVYEFSTIYPNIEIIIEESLCPQMETPLQEGSIDIAFLRNFESKNYEFIPLLKDPGCLAMHESHPLAAYNKVPVDLLDSCSFIMYPSPCYNLTLKYLFKKDITPNIKVRTANDAAALALVSKNVGVYLLSYLNKHRIPNNVVARELESDDYCKILGIAFKSFKQASPAVKEFVKIAQRVAENHPLHFPS